MSVQAAISALCTLLFFLLPLTANAQTISVEPAEIVEGDVATLTVEYRNPILSLFQLQTASLNSNFKVLDVKPSVHRDPDPGSSMNIMRWQVALTPIKTGTLSIAPIPVREHHTPKISIRVIPRARSAAASEQIEIQTSAEPLTALPGEQIIVTTHVLHNRSLRGYRLSESETSIADRYLRDITPASASGTPQRQTRRIAIFIDKPGTFIIPAATLRADIENLDPGGTMMAEQPTRSVFRKSEPLSITIDEPPEPIRGTHWLPARNLQIEQQWESPNATLRAGDSLASTLTITARGLMASALPADILAQTSTQFSLFSDSPERYDNFDGSEVTAKLTQRYVLVLNHHGEIELPTIRVHWWDINEKRARVATVPGRTFTVLPTLVPEARDNPTTASAKGLAVAAFAMAAALTGFAFWHYRHRRAKRFRLRQLRHACRKANARVARDQLIYWARENSAHSVCGLRSVAQQCSPALQTEIMKLEHALYATSSATWNGEALWRQFNLDCNKPPTASEPMEHLPDLYPQ